MKRLTSRGKRAVEITGAKELRETLTDFAPNEVRNIMRQAVYGLAVRARDEMKRRVKKTTGQLAESFFAKRKRGEPNHPQAEVRGGSTAPYMLMLEFGTSKTKAQPFIMPTVEDLRAQQAAWYREEFAAKLEKVLARRARKAAKTK